MHCSLHIQSEHLTGTGTLWNASLEGCRISTHLPLQVGATVGLVILFPEPIGPMLVKNATVCWTRGPEYGLRLVMVHPVEAARLQRFVTQAVRQARHAQFQTS
ncbi:MAG: PilZ domain-containing protein [Nitrospira sp.]|nr:PilZ domain-containing protein [Nitrospira sp.]